MFSSHFVCAMILPDFDFKLVNEIRAKHKKRTSFINLKVDKYVENTHSWLIGIICRHLFSRTTNRIFRIVTPLLQKLQISKIRKILKSGIAMVLSILDFRRSTVFQSTLYLKMVDVICNFRTKCLNNYILCFF